MTEEFTFDPDLHIYRDSNGLWVPSVTQIISAQGLAFDFERYVSADVLSRKSKIGTAVHKFTDFYDLQGSIDETWLTMETEGYYQSWVGFRHTSGFVPKNVSNRRVACVAGLRWGMELDKHGFLGKYEAILDLKCTAAISPAHGLQLAAYEMGWRGMARCGRILRAVVQLFDDGRPGKLIPFEKHDEDADQFLAAAKNVGWRVRNGYLKEPIAA